MKDIKIALLVQELWQFSYKKGIFPIGQSGEGSRWRVSYQQAYPVYFLIPILEMGSTVLLLPLLLCYAQGTPLDSETEWTGELWLNRVLLILEN